MMRIFNVSTQRFVDSHAQKNWYLKEYEYFLLCAPDEVEELQSIFPFDQETIEECRTVDENVRFDSFERYDFISLNHFFVQERELVLNEINLYVGANYVILIGDLASAVIEGIGRYVFQRLQMTQGDKQVLNKVYYWIFDRLLSDLALSLEDLDGALQTLETGIIEDVQKEHFKEIIHWREQVTRATKYLRPLLYIGDQFLVNENNFIYKEKMRYFKNIDVRINKLYDFAVSLKELSDQLIYLYDSSLTSKTNDIAHRLTVLAIFFGPLTVITGIYGMNFEYMPELRWVYGYPAVLGVMSLTIVVLFLVFRKKRWL